LQNGVRFDQIVKSINRISKNKESILEKTYQGMSSLNFILYKRNPLCYTSGTWRVQNFTYYATTFSEIFFWKIKKVYGRGMQELPFHV